MSSQNLSMEIVYTRKKSRMTFKGIVNKVIISAMVLGCVIGGASPAFAAGNYDVDNYNFTIQSETSSEAILAEIQNTINAVKDNISNGAVSTQYLEQLASQINRLNSAASSTNRTTISNLLNEAEKVAKRVSNGSAVKVQAAIAAARVSLGLDQVDAITAADQSLNINNEATNNLNSNKKTESISIQATNRTAVNFSDVEPGNWYYNPIMQCVEKGLMQGMGDGKFSPTTQMTVAQFITVAVNASYSSELAKQSGGSNWWDAAYKVAVNNGLITPGEYDNNKNIMNAPITRKEMARIASRVTVAKGETTQTLTSTSVIADYNSIGGTYKSFVVDCFAKGILQGTDNKGTFNPDGVLTRAEACTVALKLVDSSTRTPLKGATNVDTTTPVASNGTEYREGQSRTNFPQVGDVIIKADGTKVTLQYGPGGVLGAGQGVDIYSGITIKGTPIRIGSIVPEIDGTPLAKDSITGEVHTKGQWKDMKAALSPSGKYVGDYDGEIYETWFEWDAATNLWCWIGPSF